MRPNIKTAKQFLDKWNPKFHRRDKTIQGTELYPQPTEPSRRHVMLVRSISIISSHTSRSPRQSPPFDSPSSTAGNELIWSLVWNWSTVQGRITATLRTVYVCVCVFVVCVCVYVVRVCVCVCVVCMCVCVVCVYVCVCVCVCVWTDVGGWNGNFSNSERRCVYGWNGRQIGRRTGRTQLRSETGM